MQLLSGGGGKIAEEHTHSVLCLKIVICCSKPAVIIRYSQEIDYRSTRGINIYINWGHTLDRWYSAYSVSREANNK